MNVLLTSVGRRNYLLTYFREVLNPAGGRVVATDAEPTAPGLVEADVAIRVRPILAPGYADEILAICERHQIQLVVCLNDVDLIVLSEARDRFEAIGATPLFPARDEVLACADKWLTFQLLSSAGIDTPRTWTSLEQCHDEGDPSTGYVVKPRFGSASIGIHRVDTLQHAEQLWDLVDAQAAASVIGRLTDQAGSRVIVQEALPGVEHGLDILSDLDGNFAALTVKQKLSMRAGETDKARIVSAGPLEPLARQLALMIGHRGVLDADVFIADNRVAVLELNPRFGGGYPFSHEAGMNAVAAIVEWRTGAEPSIGTAAPGEAFSKVDRLVQCPPRSGAESRPRATS